MHPCNRGETLTRSVQENTANRTLVTTIRPQLCERTELFIGIAACGSGLSCTSNFPFSPQKQLALSKSLMTDFCLRCESRLESNTMIGPERFRRCACAYL